MLKLRVSIQTTAEGERQPSDIVCVLDTSGSMSAEAVIMGASGSSESHGLSLLDVAKHGVRTIVKALSDKDRLAVVPFSHTANVLFPLTYMDEAGQQKAFEALEALEANGGTNMWQALEAALPVLQASAGRPGHFMVLTDGESREREHIIPKLLKYMQQHDGLPGTITTFGFGYNLDSKLLVDLAAMGTGSYSFIPDAGFVGTAFVNMLAQLLSTVAQDAYLSVEVPEGAGQILEPCERGLYSPSRKGCRLLYHVGTLQIGQPKDIVIPVRLTGADGEAEVSASLNYRANSGARTETPSQAGTVGRATAEQDRAVEEQVCRCAFVDCLSEAVKQVGSEEAALARAKAGVDAAIARVRAQAARDPENPRLEALLEDMQGQTTEAFSKWAYYRKWGQHYVPSLMCAHKLQICNNFKDPGVQVYGGDLFKQLRDEADDIFCSLPPPKPTVPARPSVRPSAGGGRPAPARAAPVSMRAYHNASAG